MKPKKKAPAVVPAPPRYDRRHLTQSEFRALLAVANDEGGLSQMVVRFGYLWGLRASEYGLLTLDCLKNLHDKRLVYVLRAKGGASAWHKAGADDAEVLRDWVNAQYPAARERQPNWPLYPAPFAWRGETLRPISRFTVWRLIQRLCLEAGVDKALAHPHVLRHSRIMHLLESAKAQGLTPGDLMPVVASIVGHASARTTVEHYFSMSEGAAAAVERVTAALLEVE